MAKISSCYPNKIESVSSVQENVHIIADLSAKRIQALSQLQTFLGVLPTRWRHKSTGIDMEQNYVTITLCVACWLRASERIKFKLAVFV